MVLCEEVMQLFEYAPATLNTKGVLVAEEPLDDDKSVDETAAAAGDDKSDEKDNPENDKTEQETETQSKTETKSVQLRRSYPTCWFEDEESGEPLRWHLFVGVLYDSMEGRAIVQHSSRAAFTSESVAPNLLPWRIRVHFSAYPATLLPFEILNMPSSKMDATSDTNQEVSPANQISTTIGRIFRNSLKQALFMQYSSSKVAMSITKSSHEKIWDAMLTTNYTLYNEVNGNLQMGISNETDEKIKEDKVPELIPVRLMLNNDSPMQKPCRAYRVQDKVKKEFEVKTNNDDETEDEKTLDKLVDKLTTCSITPQTTLGDLLVSWLPEYFERDSDDAIASKSSVQYFIQGIEPNFSCSLLDLWRALCHPDHFLYIVVVTKT